MTTEYRQALGGLETLAAELRRVEADRVQELVQRLPGCERWVAEAEHTVTGVEEHLGAWWSQAHGVLYGERWVSLGQLPLPDVGVDPRRLGELMDAMPAVGERLARVSRRWWRWLFPW